MTDSKSTLRTGAALLAAFALMGAGAASAAPDVKTFVNDKADIAAPVLSAAFVGFHFDYPADWKAAPETRQKESQNFARVTAPQADGFIDTETFTVGSLRAGDDGEVAALLDQLEAQLKTAFPNYSRVSAGDVILAGADGREFRFESHATAKDANTPGGDLSVWGRVIALPAVTGAKNGLLLFLLATDRDEAVDGAGDLGETGGLKTILDSFTLD